MIKIVADSTHYVPSDLVALHDIHTIPILLLFGSATYREGVDLDTETFFRMLAAGRVFPTTSQPSQQDFLRAWQPLLDAGHEVITLLLSSLISGAFKTAESALAQLLPGAPVSVVDSRSTAMGLGFQVLHAAELAQRGLLRADILAALAVMRGATQTILVPDTLENLRRGGRISAAKAFLGAVLRVKPLLSFSRGFVEPLEQVRTTARAQERLIDLTVRHLGGDTRPWIAVMHSRSPDRAQFLLSRLEPLYPHARFFCAEIGPVLGVHLGIGGTGIMACPGSAIRDG